MTLREDVDSSYVLIFRRHVVNNLSCIKPLACQYEFGRGLFSFLLIPSAPYNSSPSQASLLLASFCLTP